MLLRRTRRKDYVVDCRTSSFKARIDILANLLDPRPHIAPANDIPGLDGRPVRVGLLYVILGNPCLCRRRQRSRLAVDREETGVYLATRRRASTR